MVRALCLPVRRLKISHVSHLHLHQKTTTICTVAYFLPPLYCLLRASEIPWQRSKPYTQQTHLAPGIAFSDREKFLGRCEKHKATKPDRLFLLVKAIMRSWYLVSTLPCNPLPLVNATRKKQCWPWETGFEGVFLKARVCNWVEQQAAGFDGVRASTREAARVRVGTHGRKEGEQKDTREQKHTQRNSLTSVKHIRGRCAAGPAEPTARRFGRLWVLTQQPFGTDQASHHPDRSEWAQFFFFFFSSKNPLQSSAQPAPNH